MKKIRGRIIKRNVKRFTNNLKRTWETVEPFTTRETLINSVNWVIEKGNDVANIIF